MAGERVVNGYGCTDQRGMHFGHVYQVPPFFMFR